MTLKGAPASHVGNGYEIYMSDIHCEIDEKSGLAYKGDLNTKLVWYLMVKSCLIAEWSVV